MKRASATIRIDPANEGVDPAIVAKAVAPDDTAEMTSRLDEGVLETRIERDAVGGLRSTVDDYVVNLGVALQVASTRPDTQDASDASDGENSTTKSGSDVDEGDDEAGDTNDEADGVGEKRQE